MGVEGIDVFIEVVDAQSFAGAAHRLGMPTTTVSAKIARLERSLGVTLIQRTTRRLHVTPAGHLFYQRCVRALAELREGKRELEAGKQEPLGVLRISAPRDVAQTLLTPLVGRFIILYPKTSIDLIITDRSVDLIAERVDLAIRVGPLADSRLVIRKFRSLRGGFWASADYIARKGFPKSPTELKDHDVIRPSRLPEDILLSSPAGEVVEFQRTARLATDDLASLMSLILYGCGIGYLPEFFAEHAGSSGSLVRVLPDYVFPGVELNFVYPSQAFVPLNVRAFLAIADADVGRSTDDPGVGA